MVGLYNGNYQYNGKVIGEWNSTAAGVYYCGYHMDNGNLYVLYVGKATSNQGIRGRLLQHLNEDKWPDVSHFGYCVCSTSEEAENFEASEIKRLKPKYNIQGKSYSW
jgi:excinuclease UvrABC nuclease subunit